MCPQYCMSMRTAQFKTYHMYATVYISLEGFPEMKTNLQHQADDTTHKWQICQIRH